MVAGWKRTKNCMKTKVRNHAHALWVIPNYRIVNESERAESGTYSNFEQKYLNQVSLILSLLD